MNVAPRWTPPDRPTLYFVGVTTGGSSIMRVFPNWAAHLGLGDVAIRGIDLPVGAPADAYRSVVSGMKADPLARGALVTTHKLDLFAACRDLFDAIDPYADQFEETSCLAKPDGQFTASAKDPITSGLAMKAFVPADHWRRFPDACALILGAGGAGVAISCALLDGHAPDDRPAEIILTDRSDARLDGARDVHARAAGTRPVRFETVASPVETDQQMARLPPGSLVVNATGLGKDGPGSPIGDQAAFPQDGLVWELNYRGERLFLHQAAAQAGSRALTVEDGWRYFIHGWTRVIADVFAIDIATDGPGFEALSAIAADARG